MPEQQYSTVTQVITWASPSSPSITVDSSTDIETSSPTLVEVLNELGENGWKVVNSLAFPLRDTNSDIIGQITVLVMERNTQEFLCNSSEVVALGHTWR